MTHFFKILGWTFNPPITVNPEYGTADICLNEEAPDPGKGLDDFTQGLNNRAKFFNEFLIYSSSSVRGGHVRLQLSEYTTSSDSFIPIEALNDTIIAKEFGELKVKDPKRAEAL